MRRPSTVLMLTVEETLEDRRKQGIMEHEDREQLDSMLAKLDDRKCKILMLRFGIDGDGPSTLQKISEIINLSRERVRQLIKESLDRLQRISTSRA